MPIFRKKDDRHFTYSATEQAPPFPLDYTTGELMEKWDVSWDILMNRTFKHKQFRDFFLRLQYDDETLKESTKSSKYLKSIHGHIQFLLGYGLYNKRKNTEESRDFVG